MGVEYDIVWHGTREGYELGRGPWADPAFRRAIRELDAAAVATLMAGDGFDAEYSARVAAEVVNLARGRGDFDVIDDHSSDISVVDAGAWLTPGGASIPQTYIKIGSRYSGDAGAPRADAEGENR